ncbi:uncharacterized protein VB005_02523 [Metarhizium brunneum]
MSLRRKPAFRRTSETGSVKASLYAYPDRDLEKDYIIWNSINGIKVGQCRHENTRQLVIVQEVKRISVSQFSRVLRIFHENIASPIFLYKSHIIYEFVDLDIVDVLPLSQPEIANAMAQAMSAVYAALEETLTFRIDTVRISHLGVVKLILDWNFEGSVDKAIFNANIGYLAMYLAETMDVMGKSLLEWDQNGRSFRSILCSGKIPALEVR